MARKAINKTISMTMFSIPSAMRFHRGSTGHSGQ